MKALQIDRSVVRFAAARVASGWRAGSAGRAGPLRLVDIEPPSRPGPEWQVVRPRMSGICGSDLATLEGRSSRWFEPIVSFPFVPGHEVVGDADDGRRVVLEPVLHCYVRGIEPACPACQAGRTNHCERLVGGHLQPGLQTGFCADTGGGWSLALVAHARQLHEVPAGWSDEAAVMTEPTACAVHGALSAPAGEESLGVVIGAGTLGLATIAAVRRLRPDISSLLAVAKHPEQRRLAAELGATAVVTPGELRRAVRRATGSWILDNGQLTGGAPVVFDCVGSGASLSDALAVTAPGGTIVLLGMPGHVGLDLTGLWQREVRLMGAYAYGVEPTAGGRHSFDLAMEVVDASGLERLVGATYGLDRFVDAIEHAAAAGRRGTVKVAFDLRGEKGEGNRMPRPGFVLDVDRSTPSILTWHGEGFRLERLPAGRSRVVYAPEPLDTLDDPDEAVREALLHPRGDSKPLPDLLFPGMRLTIAFDDISLPLPPMHRPDNRQRVIEAVLDAAAAAGVDDVVLICALALHRRMTEAELRHAVGDRVYDAFAPHGLLVQHDAEDPDGLTWLGQTDRGEDVEINKRAAESDLLVYVNINLVAMDGGHKSVATGLASYRSLRHHHNVTTMRHSRSFMDQAHSELHSSNWRMGRLIAASGVRVFQIETTLNNDALPEQMAFLQRREWEWTARDRATYLAVTRGLSMTPPRIARGIFQSIKAPYGITSVHAGEVEAVHAATTEMVLRQQVVNVEGQTDVAVFGLPHLCPYNVNSIMNPILVMCMGLGYLFNMYRGRPLVREGGVAILSHPTPWAFHPVHHPSYIDFFEEVLGETTDPVLIEKTYEERFATDEWYRHLYRTSHAYHGVHPFYMWYWGAHALEHLGRVIVVGGEPRAVRRLGFSPASSLADALEMASDTVGRDPTITHLHCPPIMIADVH